MAYIHELTDKKFPDNVATIDAVGTAYSTLDLGLFHAGKMVETIRDLVVHPNHTIDVDGVAAATDALLSYLGSLGQVLDALEGIAQLQAAQHRHAA